MHHLTDYRPPHYALEKTVLEFFLDPQSTLVKAELHFKNVDTSLPLVLEGEHMTLLAIAVNGRALDESDYDLTDKTLTIYPTKKEFVLATAVVIEPENNTRLMGLYASDGMLCTQCEPQGFRSITYYPDHSDVPSRFTVTLHADRQKYPVLLSNGNKIKEGEDFVVFEDPFPKPCYLFALVAGDLESVHDKFITASGREVALGLYCEKGKKDRLLFALEALKKAMAWDEKVFGLEYDLDVFSIVAVSHFNAGAMENKSLNIFNDTALLASPDTATDVIYEYIEHVVAHEYFHNYSGDRVTLRNWFNLTLKEGFTVYRDQEFGYDTRAGAVGRIDDVQTLKAVQFPEDDGPLAHPVLPAAYQEIDNFYTMTVYEKGAEVVRMLEVLLGREVFLKACRHYFTVFDGQAVTVDEFVRAMEEVSGRDLTAFKRWYHTAGRPKVAVRTQWKDGVFTVSLTQSHRLTDEAFVIPLRFGLIGADGRDLVTGVFELDTIDKTFVFENLPEKPVLSLNRGFSAPVDIDFELTAEERRLMMRRDSDLFNRYDVAHRYALDSFLKQIAGQAVSPDEEILTAFASHIAENTDPAFKARVLALPTVEEVFDLTREKVDLQAIKTVRQVTRQAAADRFEADFVRLYHDNLVAGPYSPDAEAAGKRALKNTALAYLALTPHASLVRKQYETADNLTDRLAALSILVQNNLPGKKEALADFYARYQDDDLVLNKWFSVQARTPGEKTLTVVRALLKDPHFDYKNPNKVRALIGAFGANLEAFHRKDGAGYRFFAKQCRIVDALNPHLSARMAAAFSKFRKFDAAHQAMVRGILQDMLDDKKLSSHIKEMLGRILTD